MSVNYASGLSQYVHKGKCGMPEKFDPPEVVKEKALQLADMIRNCKRLVVITGAGLSTACGIPDFRGPKGVWTMEQKGEAPETQVTFSTAKPSFTHLALVALESRGVLKYLISQNVDGLHVRSGFPRNRLAELHGNMFVEQCNHCHAQYIRKDCVSTMALRPTGNVCTQQKRRGDCRGKLHDTILDWEDALPDAELDMSDQQCRQGEVCLCLGTSLQILPCGNMPLLTKKNRGKIVIINLQVTKHDKKCDLKINAFIDEVMTIVCESLCLDVPVWNKPIVNLQSEHTGPEEVLPLIIVDPELSGSLEFKPPIIRSLNTGTTQPDTQETDESNCRAEGDTNVSCRDGSKQLHDSSTIAKTGNSIHDFKETKPIERTTDNGLGVKREHPAISKSDSINNGGCEPVLKSIKTV